MNSLPPTPTKNNQHLANNFSKNFHSDCPLSEEDEEDGTLGVGQRSVSLTTLQSPTVIEPRMAQLETLEAKMASIEVSLSASTPRRKKNLMNASIRSIPKEFAARELETLRNALRDKENIIQSLRGQLTIPGLRLNGLNGNINSSMKNGNVANGKELTENEKKQAEERLNRLRGDVDNKRLAIKNLKMALEKLDITDNIDVRIQQAELEYQLGREELNLLTLLEETRALQLCLDESNKNTAETHTLYSCVHGNDHVVLLGVEVEYDPKSPKFGASSGQKEHSTPGLWIDWALEETGLLKGDRLIEVNGKIVLTKTRDDLSRLLMAAPDPAQLVILRKIPENGRNNCNSHSSIQNGNSEVTLLRNELDNVKERAEEAQRAKDGLVSDNIRLTHRISYLEEQVSELLSRTTNPASDIRIVAKPTPVISTVKTSQNITNINITTQPKEMQVFQKGPQVTALVANLDQNKQTANKEPIRSKSSLSNVSNTHIPAPSPQPDDNFCHKHHSRHKSRSRHSSISTDLDQNSEKGYRKHHHHRDYGSESGSTVTDNVAKYNKRNSGYTEYQNGFANPPNPDSLMDQSYKKATKIVQELTRTSNHHHNNNRTNLYEKHRQKCPLTASEKYNSELLQHYNSRKSASVLDFRSEVHIGGSKMAAKMASSSSGRPNDVRSVKSLDFDSDFDTRMTNGHSDGVVTKPRPTPPKKPLRLSLHKTQSLQSVENNGVDSAGNKNDCRKRNYKGEVPVLNGGEMINHSNGFNKWTSFGNLRRNGIESDAGTWC